MGRLSGRCALVTGAAMGIGRAVAVRLAQEGARVAVMDLAEPALDETRALIGDDALALKVDITDREALLEAVEQVKQAFGQLHVLHANAGVVAATLTSNCSPQAWDQVIGVNLTGTFHTIQACLPLLRAAEGHRAVVATSSVQALRGTAWTVAYDTSKAGITGMVRAVAHEFAAYGITVNAVAPGPIETRMLGVGDDQAKKDRLASRVPVGRLGRPEDIAGAVAFFASDDASFITGQVLPVDGGLIMNAPGRAFRPEPA